MSLPRFSLVISSCLAALGGSANADIAAGREGFNAQVAPFFKEHCINCHGPEKSKGKVTLHTLTGDFSDGAELERWSKILKAVESGDMPPDDKPQPPAAVREAVAKWIGAGVHGALAKKSGGEVQPVARRLTNFEYENTMRDLLGFRLKLTDNLPEDPVKAYRFNNTANYMRIGMEQMDRYMENARRAMASAIVDPEKPKIHTSSAKWEATGINNAMGSDEIGYDGNRRGTPAGGMGVKSWPATGEYRIRVTAAAVLPPGYSEVPMRVLIGHNQGNNGITMIREPVGTVNLKNDVDHPQVFEFRGRIENAPIQPGDVTAKGQAPPSLGIIPQNLFDNGYLNDRLSPLSLPRVVVKSIEFEAPVFDMWPPEHHTRILFESPLRKSDPKAYVREVLGRFMSRAYRRPVTADELNLFAKIYSDLEPQFASMEETMRETLALVLVSPQFLYHAEACEHPQSAQFELASRLSYFLWATMPDQQLIDLATQGQLEDPKVLDGQVRRMLADPRAKDFFNSFTTQWLSIAKTKAVKINLTLFPRFLYTVPEGESKGIEMPHRPTVRDYMLEESVAFFGELVRRNASVLNIVHSDFACLNERLAAHYGVPGVQGADLRPVPLKPDYHLGGVLTQGSVLVGNSTGSAPHPIYRAVWLREAILGEDVKDPPAEVPALVDSAGEAAEKAVTIKDLLRKHRQVESCNDCHARLDPWGIAFEAYNAIGKYQPMVAPSGKTIEGVKGAAGKRIPDIQAEYQKYLDGVCTVKVETNTRLPNGPEVDGMDGLKAYLLKSRKEEIGENIVRKLLSYGIGRELTYRDRLAVRDLAERAKKNDYKLQDIIVAICQSEAFRKTSVRPSTVAKAL